MDYRNNGDKFLRHIIQTSTPHRHHPRRHHVVIMARRNATTEHNMNYIPHKAYRDMAESDYSYGDTE